MQTHERIIAQTRCWVERVVVALNLCPFAKPVVDRGRVRYVVSDASSPEQLVEALHTELVLLEQTPAAEIDTTVLIHPWVLGDFLDYNDFLDVVDAVIHEGGWDGTFQIASLHPHYRFAGTEEGDVENFTNRSPYPCLHLIREASVAEALLHYARPDKIPERNIRTVTQLGREQLQRMLDECLAVEAGDG